MVVWPSKAQIEQHQEKEEGKLEGKKNNKTYYLMDLERTRKGKAEIFRCGERNW